MKTNNLRKMEQEESRKVNGGYVLAGIGIACSFAKDAWNLGQYLGGKIVSSRGRTPRYYWWN